MTRTITLAAGDSADIGIDWTRHRRVQIENRSSSGGTLYYGAVPVSLVVPANVEAAADEHMTLPGESAGLGLQVGMVLTDGDGLLDADTLITGIQGRVVYFAGVPSLAGLGSDLTVTAQITATAPAISATNGHELLPGQRESFAHGDFQTGRGIRVVAGTGGCTVTITEMRN